MEGEKKEVGVQLVGFRTTHFLYQRPKSFNINLDKHEFNVQVGFRTEENDHSRIVIIVDIHVHLPGVEKIHLGSIQTESVFELKNPHEAIVVQDGTVNLPEQLMVMIISISISTTRGALLSRGAGTLLENAVLPIIDMKPFHSRKTNS